MHLKPYYLSKWICPHHGHFQARTANRVDPRFPIHCPECKAQFVSQLAGRTSQEIPYISKPRIPKTVKHNPNASEKAPVRKRGVSW